MEFVKPTIVLVGLSTFAAGAAKAAPINQNCNLVYGASPFSTLTFEYNVVKRTASDWAVVDMLVDYTRTSREKGVEYLPIKKTNVEFSDIVNLDATFDVESTGDYAFGRISFERDDSAKGPLAVLNYSSDGMNGFAIYECSDFPDL
jgi:hypothetical protein